MKNKLLVVVDMQRDFVNGKLGFQDAIDITQNVVNKINKYLRDDDGLILFTYDTHSTIGLNKQNYFETREGKYLPVMHCEENSEGWKLIDEIDSLIKDINLDHKIYKIKKWNKFGIGINEFINNKDFFDNHINSIDQIEICGVVTNLCVLSVAISLQNIFNNADIIIDKECCASPDKVLHDQTINIMKNLQMKII